MSALHEAVPETSPISSTSTRRVSPRAIYVLVLLIVTGLSLLYLSQTSDLAATSYDVAALQNEKSVWEMRNEQLRLQIAEVQSLDHVDQVASSRLGMGPPAHVVYVSAPDMPIEVPKPTATPTPSAGGISAASIRDIIQRFQSGEGFHVGQ